jgi:hypothetical protein
MNDAAQVVVIAPGAASFTVVCHAGRLDLDLQHGRFLCRRGHNVLIERAAPPAEQSAGSATAA